MRAVVLDTRDGFAAVLREDGTVEKIRRACRVGETIELAPKKPASLPRRLVRGAVAAAAAIILLTGGAYGYNHALAYSYVTLDINPSIEYVLNRSNEVMSVTALNEDAAAIVDAVNAGRTSRESLGGVIRDTTALLYENAYLGADKDNCILINVASGSEDRTRSLVEEVETCYSDNDEIDLYVTVATTQEAKQAKSMGISTGRYKIAEELDENGVVTEQTAQAVSGAAVRQLVDESPSFGPAAAAERPAPTLPGTTPAAPPAAPSPADAPRPGPETEAPAAPENTPASPAVGQEAPPAAPAGNTPGAVGEAPVPSDSAFNNAPSDEDSWLRGDGANDTPGTPTDSAIEPALPTAAPAEPTEAPKAQEPARAAEPAPPERTESAPAAPTEPQTPAAPAPTPDRNEGPVTFWDLVDDFFNWM